MEPSHARHLMVLLMVLGIAITIALFLTAAEESGGPPSGDSSALNAHDTAPSESPAEAGSRTEDSSSDGDDTDPLEAECEDGVPVRYEVGDGENEPDNERYVNRFQARSRPKWVPEYQVSMESPEAHTYEVTRMPNASPTKSDLDEAWSFYRRSFEAAQRHGWFDFEQAREDGFQRVDSLHYINPVNSFVRTNESLEEDRPETLMYVEDPESGRRVLAGFMYSNLEREGEQFAGPMSLWHYHPSGDPVQGRMEEILDSTPEVDANEIRQAYRVSEGVYRSPEMIHVWFLRHPEGPFASSMEVPTVEPEPEMMSECEFKHYALENYQKYFAGQLKADYR